MAKRDQFNILYITLDIMLWRLTDSIYFVSFRCFFLLLWCANGYRGCKMQVFCKETKWNVILFLKKRRKGKKPRRVHTLDDGDVEQLFVQGQHGLHSSQSLLDMLWLFSCICFGMRGGTQHRHLWWGGVMLKMNSDDRGVHWIHRKQT